MEPFNELLLTNEELNALHDFLKDNAPTEGDEDPTLTAISDKVQALINTLGEDAAISAPTLEAAELGEG